MMAANPESSSARGCLDAPDPMRIRRARIERRERETADTISIDVAPLERGDRVAYDPGQFHMVYAFGCGESAISISGYGSTRQAYTLTIRAVGQVTRALANLEVGSTIGFRGPFGTGWPMSSARGKDIVLVAGGIGLAPVRSALRYIMARRSDFRRVVVAIGARSPDQLVYRDEIEEWEASPNLDVRVTVDHATPLWRGNVGVVTGMLRNMGLDAENAVAMICGPEIMMRYTVGALRDLGIEDRDTYVSMERNMKCAVGFCGHCQFGPKFICRDGPVFSYDAVRRYFEVSEI